MEKLGAFYNRYHHGNERKLHHFSEQRITIYNEEAKHAHDFSNPTTLIQILLT